VIPFPTLDAQWAKMGRLAILVRRQDRGDDRRSASSIMAVVASFLLVLSAAGGCSRVPRIIVLEDPLTAAEHVELGVAYERRGSLTSPCGNTKRALRKDRSSTGPASISATFPGEEGVRKGP